MTKPYTPKHLKQLEKKHQEELEAVQLATAAIEKDPFPLKRNDDSQVEEESPAC